MRFRLKTTQWLLVLLVFVGFTLGLLLRKVEFFQDKTSSKPGTSLSSQYSDFQSDNTTVTSNPQTVSIQDSKSQPQIQTTIPSQKVAFSTQASKSQQKTNQNSLPKVETTPTPNTPFSTQASKSQPQQKTNQKAKSQNTPSQQVKTTAAFKAYKPRYGIAWANPTNYGERFTKDVYGRPVNNQPIIVLHETDAPASSAVNFFQNSNEDENIQASYHSMIKLDGTVVYIVPPEKRAFGAANSEFDGPLGSETVKTNPLLASSVNNFAYHIGLETPPSGLGNNEQTHTGYTDDQYQSLAWLVAQSNVPEQRITTHKLVDRSGQKIDPRSFDFNKFLKVLHSFRRIVSIH